LDNQDFLSLPPVDDNVFLPFKAGMETVYALPAPGSRLPQYRLEYHFRSPADFQLQALYPWLLQWCRERPAGHFALAAFSCLSPAVANRSCRHPAPLLLLHPETPDVKLKVSDSEKEGFLGLARKPKGCAEA